MVSDDQGCTDFRRMEHQNELMRSMFAVMSEGIMAVDGDGKVRACNRHALRLLGLDPDVEAVLGREVGQLGIEALSRPLSPHEEPVVQVVALTQADSRSRSIRFVRHALPDPSDPTVGFVAVIQDVSREKETEALQNEFFSMVTHELKTPLLVMEGYAHLLQTGKAGPVTEEQHEFLRLIVSQSEMLKGMIQSLLDVARLAAGRFELTLGQVAVEGLIFESRQCYSHQAEAQGVGFDYCPPEDPVHRQVEVVGDVGRLDQVLSNLLSNAIKFTPEGGRIGLSWRVDTNAVIIEVSDTGVGIPEESLEPVFDKFYQVVRGEVRRPTGAGLGLYICREIVEAHGGTIRASSSGQGTCFVVRLPISAPVT